MKKAVSIIISGLITAASMPLSGTFAAYDSSEKWDRFLRYDLCITDYDSLSDSEKELCRFIFDTEQSAEDTVICERARRTLAGDENIGERLTLADLEDCCGIWDNFSATKIGELWYTHCVPDIKHLDGFDDFNEYWLDDSGKVKVCFIGENSGEGIASFGITVSGLTDEEAHTYDSTSIEKQSDGTYTVRYEISTSPEPAADIIDVDGDLYYIMSDGNAALYRSRYAFGNGLADRVTVPDEVDGHKVTVIGTAAFIAADVRAVVLPETIECINGKAFYACAALERADIQSGLKYIGASAFYGCESLADIAIDSPGLDIPVGAFGSCTSLENAELNVRSIGEGAFGSCTSLTTVSLGGSVGKIAANAFENCISLSRISLPDSVKFIGQGAFAGTSVKEIVIAPQAAIIGVFPSARGIEARSAFEPAPAFRPLDEEPVCAFPADCTILGSKNTEAERYANEWGLDFRTSDSLKGDANLDSRVSVADAVAILQHIALRDKYELRQQGLINADVDGADGVTANDARVIFQWDSQRLL